MKSPVNQHGFTILELMVVVGLVAILSAVAIPGMQDFIRNNRLTSAANDLLRSTQLARSEAIKQQQNIVVCASTDPSAPAPACSFDAFRGWISFQDLNNNWNWDAGEMINERHDLLHTTVTVISDNDAIISYGRSGFSNPAGARTPSLNIVICDSRGNAASGGSSTARAVLLDATGRSRTTKTVSEIATAIDITGKSCS
jgi:type IV fimbrial biogenesis protein FimT